MYKPLVLWVEAQIKNRASFELPELVDEAIKLYSHDPEYIRQSLRPAMYDQIQHIIASLRTQHVAAAAIAGGSSDAARVVKHSRISQIREAINADRFRRIHQYFEHVGKRYVNVLALTRPMIKIALSERAAIQAAQQPAINFLNALLRRLPSNDVTVGKHLSLREVDRLMSRFLLNESESTEDAAEAIRHA